MITIRRLTPSDADLLRQIRLRALSDTPMAFSSTHARELAFTSETDWYPNDPNVRELFMRKSLVGGASTGK